MLVIKHSIEGLAPDDEGTIFSIYEDGRLAVTGYMDESGWIDPDSLEFSHPEDYRLLDAL